ncbi:protein SRG1-like [Argentina anserina]|uniref:protein SRG1-like n=1 Tax=Argentina anserina TaxID=57926 RepID=UPI00217643EE|nr:protein SRG1-like [Potentilla anserina]
MSSFDTANLSVEANVQELARSNPLKIPEKFFLKNIDEQDMPESTLANTSHDFSFDDIPIIDFSLLSSGHEEELKKLDLACKEWGFFQLVNHGVAGEVLQGMKDGSAKFFELPLEEKNKISILAAKGTREGYGQAHVATEEQTLDWSDALLLKVYPFQIRKLENWPTTPKGYKEAIEAYASEVKRIGEEIIRSLSLTMGMEKDVLLGLHQDLRATLRVNYIPPCSMPDKVLGLSAHADAGTITVLMQQDDIIGLQIRKQGHWVSVQPIPNSFVVNVGDALEMWSNGKYESIEHRAVTNKSKARMSFATFILPHVDVEIEPFDHILESTGMIQKYKKVKYGDYLIQSLKRKMEGKEHTQNAKLGNT